MIVHWRGHRFSAPMRDALEEWRRLATAEAIPFTITQGGWNAGRVAASAGTHDGDAVDLSVRGMTRSQCARLIELGRMIGIACWLRTSSHLWGVPAQGFTVAHIHGVPNGWGSPSAGARQQAAAYRAGRDGLARNGPDRGPGHTSSYRTRTWTHYAASTIERIMSSMDEKKLRAIIRSEAREAVRLELWAPLVPGNKGVTGTSLRNVLLHIYTYVKGKK